MKRILFLALLALFVVSCTSTQYCIHWKALNTGATGHGELIFDDKEKAELNVRTLNEDNRGIAIHWVEEVDDEGLCR